MLLRLRSWAVAKRTAHIRGGALHGGTQRLTQAFRF